ncbi:MAG: hydrogenase-4 component G [Desulfamplus sp.]|nr:hydrogenase-4 component G [Desulfamplus sp.]
METGSIGKTSANLSYEVKKFSGSIKSAYGISSSEGNQEVKKDMELNVMMSSFKFQVSSNTSDNLTNQGQLKSQLLERLGIGTSQSTSSGSSILSPKVNTKDDLFGEDGYWGVKKTSGRISDFVIAGAGDDIEKLKAGREGVLRGLKDAEKVWGGTMPDIAYQTIDTSLKAIDEKIKELGGNVVDITA